MNFNYCFLCIALENMLLAIRFSIISNFYIFSNTLKLFTLSSIRRTKPKKLFLCFLGVISLKNTGDQEGGYAPIIISKGRGALLRPPLSCIRPCLWCLIKDQLSFRRYYIQALCSCLYVLVLNCFFST